MMRRDSVSYLFSSRDAHGEEQGLWHALHQEIESYDANRLLNTNVDDLVGYFIEKYSVSIPTLDEDGKHADQKEIRIERQDYHRAISVPGVRVTIWIPFEGDARMFQIQPKSYTLSPPRGRTEHDQLIFEYEGTNLSTEEVKNEFDAWLRDVKQHLTWQSDSFKSFNDAIGRTARQAIEARRAKLLANQNVVAGLGIPLKRRPDTTTTFAAPSVKRKIAPKSPPATIGSFKPEPVLDMAEYEHILQVLQNMVAVMERSPSAFHGINEEALRTHFLMQLNGHYEGQASGETFNFEGKTDILVRHDGKNIFIAECKFWTGPSSLTAALDQILGYLSWRDSKAALLVFNRNRDFSKVLGAIPGTIEAHPKFRKSVGKLSDTVFRYVFRHKDDDAKDILVTVLAFEIPTAN